MTKKLKKCSHTNNLSNDHTIVYKDKNYTIFYKDYGMGGTIQAPYDLLDIAISGLEDKDSVCLFYKKDLRDIINRQITRLEKFVDEYED